MRGQKRTAEELNAILLHNLVPSSGGAGRPRTFGCIQWESEPIPSGDGLVAAEQDVTLTSTMPERGACPLLEDHDEAGLGR